MAQGRKRTQECGEPQAHQRLTHAKSFLDVAELTADVNDPNLEYGSVAASVAILAGIAATDAVCCHVLGRRSRSDNHHDAEDLLREITGGGKQAAGQLRKLITLKDAAHYGFISVSASQLKQSIRQTQHLVDFAENVLLR
ncbi:MAG TPA: hypothetical protein VIS95_05840 [Solirubrobacterales bacterium]